MISRKRQEALRWLAVLLLLAMPAWAQETERVKVTGIKRAWGNTEKKTSTLEGDLLITHKETKIRTSYAKLNQEKKEGTFSKGVILQREDITVASQELYVNFKKDKGVFAHDVRAVREKGKDNDGKEKEPFTLTCDRLEMDTEKEDFTATGQVVTLEHEEFTGKSKKMEYSNESETLILSGNPVLERKKGDSIKGDRIKINLKEETFEVLDNAELVFNVEEENDEAKEKDKVESQ